MVKKIAMGLVYAVIGTALAVGLLAMIFFASVDYSLRHNPPTAEEIAEYPELIRFAK